MKKRYMLLSLILILSLLLNVSCTPAPVAQDPTPSDAAEAPETVSGSETDDYSYLTRHR